MTIIWRVSDWSRGMILLLGRRGHGFNPRIGLALLAQW